MMLPGLWHSGATICSIGVLLLLPLLKEIISGAKAFTHGKKDNQISKIAFMFPGQGAQYLKMGLDLYQKNLRTSEIYWMSVLKLSTLKLVKILKQFLFESKNTEESDRRLASTEITQTALFIIEYAMSGVLEKIGIKPDYPDRA